MFTHVCHKYRYAIQYSHALLFAQPLEMLLLFGLYSFESENGCYTKFRNFLDYRLSKIQILKSIHIIIGFSSNLLQFPTGILLIEREEMSLISFSQQCVGGNGDMRICKELLRTCLGNNKLCLTMEFHADQDQGIN